MWLHVSEVQKEANPTCAVEASGRRVAGWGALRLLIWVLVPRACSGPQFGFLHTRVPQRVRTKVERGKPPILSLVGGPPATREDRGNQIHRHDVSETHLSRPRYTQIPPEQVTLSHGRHTKKPAPPEHGLATGGFFRHAFDPASETRRGLES